MKYLATVIHRSDNFKNTIVFQDLASVCAWARLMALDNLCVSPFKEALITDEQGNEIFLQKGYEIFKNLLTTRH